MGVSIEPGVLYVVATPIGNLEDITARARRLLGEVELIAAEDTRHTRALLAHLGVATPLLSLHEHNERERLALLVPRLEGGARIALVSDAGTPLISDPGFALVRECHRRGIRVSPVPGPSALTAALSASGLPTDRFRFEGFLPRTADARRARLLELAAETVTLVFYESAHRIAASLADMAVTLGGDRPAVIARELTKRFETVRSGPLAALAEAVGADAEQRLGEMVVLVEGLPPPAADAVSPAGLRALAILLEELPVKQAAALAARLTGDGRNALYRAALARREGDDR
jgi:16S rRNA (cytidine1402-2'-O)-methyltransferase